MEVKSFNWQPKDNNFSLFFYNKFFFVFFLVFHHYLFDVIFHILKRRCSEYADFNRNQREILLRRNLIVVTIDGG